LKKIEQRIDTRNLKLFFLVQNLNRALRIKFISLI